MNLLIMTTLLHYCAIYPLLYGKHNNNNYIIIIILGTSLSILYHIDETNYYIFICDYIMALYWLLHDIVIALYIDKLFIIGTLNFIIFIINIIVPYDNNYIYNHSIWHVLSAIKCIYIAIIIRKK